MLRSFSKIHGLAGLRTGWGYFPAEIAAILNRIRHPNGVTGPSIAAASAAIRDRDHIAAVRSANAALRGWFSDRLAPSASPPGRAIAISCSCPSTARRPRQWSFSI
jgi:Histidinol-phosphate/aromatic aminotransferase and cobyric acid decarboxylase